MNRNPEAVAAVARALSGDNFPSLHHVRQAESAIKAYEGWRRGQVANDNLPNAAAQFKRRAANDAPTDAELIMQAWGVEAVA